MCGQGEGGGAAQYRFGPLGIGPGQPLFTLAGEARPRSRICCSGLCGQCSSCHRAHRVLVVVLELGHDGHRSKRIEADEQLHRLGDVDRNVPSNAHCASAGSASVECRKCCSAVATIGRISSLLYSTSTSMPGTVGSIETSTISCTDCLSTFSMSRRERNVRVQEVQLDASWLHQSPLHRPSSSKKQLQLSSSIVINVKARAGARLRRSVDPMQQFVCLPYQLMRSAAGVIVVLAQLQNHCRSRETC